MSTAAGIRALHWVFKVGDRKETMRFYREVLGMRVLRHEEFEKGCEAACNGPYDGRWSKTMVGYGPEEDHFVVELTYNYNISQYKLGNDFQGITIQSSAALARARALGWPLEQEEQWSGGAGLATVRAPGGYKFILLDLPQPEDRDPVLSVAISVSSPSASLAYWATLPGLRPASASPDGSTALTCPGVTLLLLPAAGGQVEHAKAAGRIAFSCPAAQLPAIEATAGGGAVLTPLVSLDTPGKATVQVVILADPDGQEICFVGDEAFRSLSQVDPAATGLLEAALEGDKSNEWFAKKGRGKVEEA
jgi:lactoylglutathione lyase